MADRLATDVEARLATLSPGDRARLVMADGATVDVVITDDADAPVDPTSNATVDLEGVERVLIDVSPEQGIE